LIASFIEKAFVSNSSRCDKLEKMDKMQDNSRELAFIIPSS
jgi:hypothetical protein